MSKQKEKGTENSIFLDGRDYTASDLYKLIALLVGNGVYTNELAPTATNENMSITHGAGHAWVNGVAYVNTTPFVLDIDTADGSLNRYDSLMVRLDLSVNETYATIVQGEYATNPVPPACTRNAETFDLKICDIYIPAGCTKITQDQIIDTRLDSSVCGVPVYPVEHLDMTTFYRQINTDLANFKQKEQANFVAWTETQKAEILDLLEQLNNLVENDTVGELIAQINEKLSKSGGDMTGPINMQGQSLKGLNSPSEDSEAATKGYVDTMAPAFTQASALTNLTSGEKLTVSLGKIMKAITDLISHLANKSNPHGVTANQLTSGTLSSDRLPTVPVSKGGTGATTAAAALTNLGAQSKITVKKVEGASKSLSKGTVAAITSISVGAGTYLVCANATFPTYESLEPAKYTHMLCVNTSTSFDHGKATAIGNVDGMQVDLNVSTVITLASAGTIYMLGYAAAASTVTNGNLYAIKIG